MSTATCSRTQEGSGAGRVSRSGSTCDSLQTTTSFLSRRHSPHTGAAADATPAVQRTHGINANSGHVKGWAGDAAMSRLRHTRTRSPMPTLHSTARQTTHNDAGSQVRGHRPIQQRRLQASGTGDQANNHTMLAMRSRTTQQRPVAGRPRNTPRRRQDHDRTARCTQELQRRPRQQGTRTETQVVTTPHQNPTPTPHTTPHTPAPHTPHRV